MLWIIVGADASSAVDAAAAAFVISRVKTRLIAEE